MITVQKLFDSDNGFRLQFTEAELKRQSKSSSHLEFLTFSDEAQFHLDGLVHKHNFRYWHLITQIGLQKFLYIHQRQQYGQQLVVRDYLDHFYFQKQSILIVI